MHDYYAVPNQYNGFKTLSRLLDGGQPRQDRRRRRGLRPVHDGREVLRVRAWRRTSTAPSATRRTRPVPPGTRATGTSAPTAATPGAPRSAAPRACAATTTLFYVTAGHDESSTWQEFGEMLWTDRDAGPRQVRASRSRGRPGPERRRQPDPELGPDPLRARGRRGARPRTTGRTRAAAPRRRPRARARACSRTSSATCAACRTTTTTRSRDNDRNYTGYWEMMSRGTFNGPGGTHNRWQIPNQGGSALGPHHLLALQEPARRAPARGAGHGRAEHARRRRASRCVDLKARESVPADGDLAGLTVNFGDRRRPRRHAARTRALATRFYCPNRHGATSLPRRGRRPGRQRLVRSRPRRAALEEPRTAARRACG